MNQKQFKKYVAFNPASSEVSQWWTGNSLKEITFILRGCVDISGILKKWNNGVYGFGSIEIYNIKIHPKVVEGLEQ